MSQVRTENYEEMASCLITFADQLTTLSTELESAVRDCADNIDDDHTRDIHTEVRGYCTEYLRVAKQAVQLAQQLQEESEAYQKVLTKHR